MRTAKFFDRLNNQEFGNRERKKAIELARAAEGEKHDSSEVATKYFSIADQLFHDDRYEEALPLFDDTLRVDTRFAEAFDHRGWCHLILEDVGRAITDFDLAIELGAPYGGHTYEGYGIAKLLNGNQQEAIHALEQAWQSDPGIYSHYKYALVCLYAGDLVRYRKACADWLKEAQTSQSDVGGH